MALGADPATILGAVTPVPDTLSEYQFAGLLRGSRTELVKAEAAATEDEHEGEVQPSSVIARGPLEMDPARHRVTWRGEPVSPLKKLEHLIHPVVMFGIVPIFGLASAGVTSVVPPTPSSTTLARGHNAASSTGASSTHQPGNVPPPARRSSNSSACRVTRLQGLPDQGVRHAVAVPLKFNVMVNVNFHSLEDRELPRLLRQRL